MTIAIVGAGISGLSLGVELLRRERTSQLFEAAPRAGGTIRTTQRDGFLTESGPNGFLDREETTRALVEALGLTAALRPAAPSVKRRFVFTRGKLREVPSKPPAFLASDLVPLGTKLRMALEPFSGRAKEGEDESVARFARRHLGANAAAVLVDAMQSGIFAGDPEQLSLRATFPRMAELEKEHRSLVLAMIRLQKARKAQGAPAVDVAGPSGALCSFEGGLETLVRAAAQRLGPALQLGTRLTALVPSGSGWGLQLEHGGKVREERARTLVLATPAYAAAPLLQPFAPELAAELEGIAYAKVAAVHVGYAPGALRVPAEGFGFLVPHVEGRKVMGVIYVSSIFPWRAPKQHLLLTCMVGGARNPERVDLDDEALLALVKEELALTLGLTARPLFHTVDRWQRGIPQYNLGHLERVARIRALAAKLPAPLHLTGNAYDGVGLNDCIKASAKLAAELAAAE